MTISTTHHRMLKKNQMMHLRIYRKLEFDSMQYVRIQGINYCIIIIVSNMTNVKTLARMKNISDA